MPELQVGDPAPNFILPAIDGTSFDMSNLKGKRVILTFFRFSSCPFCNIRINRILKRWEEFDDDTVMVGVFDAKIDELKKSLEISKKRLNNDKFIKNAKQELIDQENQNMQNINSQIVEIEKLDTKIETTYNLEQVSGEDVDRTGDSVEFIFKAFKEDSGIIGFNKKLIFLTTSKVV